MAIQQFCKAYWQRQLESSGAKLPDGIDADSLLTEAECRKRERAAFVEGWVASFKGAELSPVWTKQAQAEALRRWPDKE